jgi:carbonic anhydrase
MVKMIRHAPLVKIFKWHLPFIFWGALFAVFFSVMYFKWYQLKPLKGIEAGTYLRLMEGNNRFAAGHPRHPDESPEHRRKMAEGQKPFAIVVTCSDSRVSPELIFDQGIGDLFVIRTAGNLLSDMELGSIEYAVEHLGVKTILVMGHEQCGAISALLSDEAFEGHIKTIIDSLKHEKEIQYGLSHHDLRYAIKANVVHQVTNLQNNFTKETKGEKENVEIKGVIYSLDDGRVLPLETFKPLSN